MGLINLPGMDDVEEERAAPEGEYDLIIVNKETGRTRAGDRDLITLLIRIEAPEDYTPVSHWLTLPNERDWQENDGRTAKLMVRNIKRFLRVFDIEWTADGFDDEELPGAKGRCLVRQETLDDGRVVNTLSLPRLAA